MLKVRVLWYRAQGCLGMESLLGKLNKLSFKEIFESGGHFIQKENWLSSTKTAKKIFSKRWLNEVERTLNKELGS